MIRKSHTGVVGLILNLFVSKDERILALLGDIESRMKNRFSAEMLTHAPYSGILEGIGHLKETVIPGYEQDIRNGTLPARPTRMYHNVLNGTIKSARQLLALAQKRNDPLLEAFSLQIIKELHALQVMIPLHET